MCAHFTHLHIFPCTHIPIHSSTHILTSTVPLLPLDHRSDSEIENDRVEDEEDHQVALIHLLILHQSGNGVDRLENTEKDDRFSGIFHEEVPGDMVHVTAVCREHGSSPDLAAGHDDERVEDGQCCDEKDADGGEVRQRFDGQNGDDEAQCQGAAVSHEDGSWMPVKNEEGGKRGDKGHGEHHHEGIVVLVAHDEERAQYDDADGSRQTVQTVNEIQSIGKARDREHRKGKRKPAQRDGQAEKSSHIVNDQTVKREKNGGDNKNDKLGLGRGVVMVVKHTYEKDKENGYKGPEILEHNIKMEKGQHNGSSQKKPDTGTARGMVDMDASVVGDVDETQFRRIVPYQAD